MLRFLLTVVGLVVTIYGLFFMPVAHKSLFHHGVDIWRSDAVQEKVRLLEAELPGPHRATEPRGKEQARERDRPAAPRAKGRGRPSEGERGKASAPSARGAAPKAAGGPYEEYTTEQDRRDLDALVHRTRDAQPD
jgi:hypothetical protein